MPERAENPKSETRNKFKSPKGKAQNQASAVGGLICKHRPVLLARRGFEFLDFHKFGFVSDFELRISGL